ncbi:MAG: hypothetical protein WCI18_09555 [Pseudomonadota bacterium]
MKSNVMGLKSNIKSLYLLIGHLLLVNTLVICTLGITPSAWAVGHQSLGPTSAAVETLNKKRSVASLLENNSSCLFYVDGMAKIKTKFDLNRYTVNSLRTELTIHIPKEQVLRVGQWSKWADGKILESTSLSNPPEVAEEHGFDPASGRYVIQTPFSWGNSYCLDCVVDDDYSGKISEFSWWVDYLDDQNVEQTLWYSNFGLNFHVDEIFTWPTYSSGSSDQIFMWLDQNAPVFDGKRACEGF